MLTYAISKEELEGFIPECLELDTFDDKWAFIALAMVSTKGLRPKGFPKFMGNNFFLLAIACLFATRIKEENDYEDYTF